MLWRPHSLLQCVLNLCEFITNDNTKKKVSDGCECKPDSFLRPGSIR